ncbi:hypothetical protein D3P07_01040 [Paenibacillus sp. 1011MAR3C5]|nr:hypothetical protein D3P07_01040 [Paenibacillus sp. 1011MAR3C5]
MHNYDDLIEALKRESELSTCSEAQKASNSHMINLYENLKKKRSSDTPTYDNGNLAMEIMAHRLADPNYTFSVRSLMNEK